MDTKALKDKILQLAMQGKLVPQDENDEPASVLLERIKKEKEQLIKNKKIKKEKALPEITEDEIPYELPNGWKWVRLGDISKNIHYGYTASAKEDIDGIKLLRITDIQNNKVNWKNVPYCDIDNNKFETYKLENDDILIVRTGGTIGKSFIVKNINYNSVFASYLIRVVPLKNINANYLKLFLETPLYWDQLIIKSQGTGQPNVNATSLKELLIPFPPLNEQKRIVKKIDSLFNLVDGLENNKQDLLQNISDVRNKSLQLAVQGKLVPQDENDESASLLIERIKKEKEQLIKDKKIKKEKALPEITEDEIPYELPKSWKWVRINNIVALNDNSIRRGPFGSAITKNMFVPKGEDTYKVYEQKNAIKKNCNLGDYYITKEHYEKLKRFKVGPGDIIISCAGTIGESYILPNGIEEGIINQALLKIRLNENIIDNIYFLNVFKSLTQVELNNSAKGSAIKNLVSVDYLKKDVLFPLPPLNEQKRIVEKLDFIMKLCDELESELNN